MPRSNRYIFTIKNCSEDEERGLCDFAFSPDTVYLVYGRQRSQSGKHLQGFFITRNEINFLKRIECFSRAYIDRAHDDNSEASKRCKQGDNFEEFGRLPADGVEMTTEKNYFREHEKIKASKILHKNTPNVSAEIVQGQSDTEKNVSEPNEYERLRALKIERNHSRLKSLGLLKDSQSSSTGLNKASNKENCLSVAKKKCVICEAPTVQYGTRSSKRNKGNFASASDKIKEEDAIWV